jgi:hypothetical protein
VRARVSICAVLALALMVGVAEAHKVPFGLAKTEIKRFTAEVCAETVECRNWSVGPCRRRSLHRVDCVSRVVLREGGDCAWVTIARAPAKLYEVRIHRKRIIC